MGLQHIAPKIAADYRAQMREETWGHLAPRKGKIYRGRFVYALGCFGDDELNPTILFCAFTGLASSPWFYEALCDFAGEQTINESGRVYSFNGTFRNYKFSGTVQQVYDAN